MVNIRKYNAVNLALENLQSNTLIRGEWIPLPDNRDEKSIDGFIEMRIDQTLIKFNVTVRNDLRMVHLPLLFELAKAHAPIIVVANQVFPKIKEALRIQNIAYLETSGNVWLKLDRTLVWIEGNKLLPVAKEKINRAFTKTGLKVVFEFLQDEAMLNVPHREIATKANVALGNVNYVLNGLKEKGFVLRLGNRYCKFHDKNELLNQWVIKYAEKLKPELEIGAFRFLKDEDFVNWKKLPIKQGETWWGGEPAGNLMTDYLKPAELTLYTLETRSDLIKRYKLIPDPKGNVRVYKKFWYSDGLNQNTVPPLLVYADLMSTSDHRCVETAQKIYDELFKGEF